MTLSMSDMVAAGGPRLGFAAWSLSSVVTPPPELALLLPLPWARCEMVQGPAGGPREP